MHAKQSQDMQFAAMSRLGLLIDRCAYGEVRALLKSGVDPNAKLPLHGVSPLERAAQNGDWACVSMLAVHGARPRTSFGALPSNTVAMTSLLWLLDACFGADNTPVVDLASIARHLKVVRKAEDDLALVQAKVHGVTDCEANTFVFPVTSVYVAAMCVSRCIAKAAGVADFQATNVSEKIIADLVLAEISAMLLRFEDRALLSTPDPPTDDERPSF